MEARPGSGLRCGDHRRLRLRLVELTVIENEAFFRRFEDIDIALAEAQLACAIFAPRPDHLRRALVETVDDHDESRGEPGEIVARQPVERTLLVDAMEERP